MEATATSDPQFNLDSFIEFLFEGLEGYVYLAANDPSDKTDWKQEFFYYPKDVNKLKQTIRAASKTLNVFIGPAIYGRADAHKEHVKASNVVWTEFDGNTPDWNDSHGEPSLIIQSSTENNTHVYWRLDEPITDVEKLEEVNRRITYAMSADSSAWDATQVLRPPETLNWKHGGLPVGVQTVNDIAYNLTVFDQLPPAPEQIKTEWEITSLPDIQDVILRYAFGPDIIHLIKANPDDIKDRSASLMNLAYACAQLGLSDNEIMAMLILADDRWEKFKHRKDRYKRLAHIIVLARNKYPEQEAEDESIILAFGFKSFLETHIEIDWVMEPLLMDYGTMLMAGPSGIGKTQLTLQFLIHICLGKDFLHYKASKPKKVLFLSLEMGHAELQVFVETMSSGLTDEEIAILEENLILIPYGEPWPLNKPQGQDYLISLIETYRPDGVAVDSIGSVIEGNMSSDESVQPFTKFNDKIRKRYNIFTWYIHHLRKVREGAASQDDIYGNQYLLNRVTNSYGVLPAKGGAIKIRNFKQRLAAKEPDYIIVRDDKLMFHSKNEDVDEMLGNIIVKASDDEGPDDMTKGGISL